MSFMKVVLHISYSSMQKKMEWFGWFLTKKIDFESQILALFDSSPQIQNSKFNHFPWVCWFLGKNLSKFVPPVWKLHNPYCHNAHLRLLTYFLASIYCVDGSFLTASAPSRSYTWLIKFSWIFVQLTLDGAEVAKFWTKDSLGL